MPVHPTGSRCVNKTKIYALIYERGQMIESIMLLIDALAFPLNYQIYARLRYDSSTTIIIVKGYYYYNLYKVIIPRDCTQSNHYNLNILW